MTVTTSAPSGGGEAAVPPEAPARAFWPGATLTA